MRLRGRHKAAAVRVVVADDADSVRDLVCLLLDSEPDFAIVGQARDGVEAVDVISRARPDLVLLDVGMPVMDGLSALPAVRRAVPNARIVMFTGFPVETICDEAAARGADATLAKELAGCGLVDRLRELRAGAARSVARSVA
jgi:DNA-binding NarL/FixJ family response regulator